MIDVTVPLRVVSPNESYSWTWPRRAKHVKSVRKAVGYVLSPHPVGDLWFGQVLISMTRRYPSRRERSSGYGMAFDDDNLTGSMKPVRDAIATWLRTNDRDPRLRFVATQAPGRDWQVRILICRPDERGSDVPTDEARGFSDSF